MTPVFSRHHLNIATNFSIFKAVGHQSASAYKSNIIIDLYIAYRAITVITVSISFP